MMCFMPCLSLWIERILLRYTLYVSFIKFYVCYLKIDHKQRCVIYVYGILYIAIYFYMTSESVITPNCVDNNKILNNKTLSLYLCMQQK